MFSNQTTLPGLGPGLAARLGALAFLGVPFLCGAALFAALVLLLAGHRRGAWRAALVAPAAVALYVAALLGVSLVSRDRLHVRGEEKYFCELDCHLAYSVADVSAPAALATVGLSPPRGRYWVVTVRARFDSLTIAPWRPRDVPVIPDPRELVVYDRAGHEYPAVRASDPALLRAGFEPRSFDVRLLPGQSALIPVLFDLPVGLAPERALLRDTELFHRVVLGDERSLLHGRGMWRL